MNIHSIKTDNFQIEKKIKLRQIATQHLEKLQVLDLFAGKNQIWKNFNCEKYYGIEIEKNKGKNLNADNLKVIPTLDLSRFNVIDCDSYGVPYAQIKALFENPTLKNNTIILYTAIFNKMSGLTKDCLKDNGIQKMYKKNKVLLSSKSMLFFKNLLYEKGIHKVTYYKINSGFKKEYGFFKT